MVLLSGRLLKPAYNAIPFLVVHDPEKELVDRVKAFVQHSIRSMPKRECSKRRKRALLTVWSAA